MNLSNNTLLITGGSSGIGRGLAEAFHARENQVVITGRREDALKQVCAAHPGMAYVVMDVTDPADIRRAAAEVAQRVPALNCLINNAGVQRLHDFSVTDGSLDEAALLEEVNTNLLGVIRCCAAFLPHLRGKPDATIVNVSSGLAFVPLARAPIYCATKAAVHSFSLSLRRQLRDTGVRVVELIPPYVATSLHDTHPPSSRTAGPPPMPLDAFIREAMEELATSGDEAAVAQAKVLQAAASTDAARSVFERMNG
jgi:uncharacterized oxidoreductase